MNGPHGFHHGIDSRRGRRRLGESEGMADREQQQKHSGDAIQPGRSHFLSPAVGITPADRNRTWRTRRVLREWAAGQVYLARRLLTQPNNRENLGALILLEP